MSEITYHQEIWAQFWPEGQHLWQHEHAPETIFDPRLHVRRGLEEYATMPLDIQTARDGDALVGYHVALIIKHPAYTNPSAFGFLWFVREPYRGQGIGMTLLQRAEASLASQDVELLWHGSQSTEGDARLKTAGYQMSETQRVKFLRGE